MIVQKYRLGSALRPFSFSVALVVCLTGILLAFRDNHGDLVLTAVVLYAGLLLQAGVNLINDYADLTPQFRQTYPQSSQLILRNFRLGLGCFFLASIGGIYLISQSGLPLLLLAILGLAGALGYTLEPINYKRRGLAVFLVFWLMGVFMVAGSYYALSQTLTWDVILVSLPVSLFTALLLLSNEIRDFEVDRDAGIGTLSVRIGLAAAMKLYQFLIVAILACSLGLFFTGLLPGVYWLLLALPVIWLPQRYLHCAVTERVPLTPATGRAFLAFGLTFCLGLMF